MLLSVLSPLLHNLISLLGCNQLRDTVFTMQKIVFKGKSLVQLSQVNVVYKKLAEEFAMYKSNMLDLRNETAQLLRDA